MPDTLSRESYEPNSRARLTESERMSAQDIATPDAPVPMALYPSTLLGSSRLGGRGNLGVHNSLMQSAQQTHGNRALQRSIQRTVSVQRDGPNFSLLPPRLELPFGNGLTGGLGLGGPDLNYQRGPFHAGAEYSWGGPLEANVGYGTPLLPWMMDVEPSMAAGTVGMNNLMNRPSSMPPGTLGALGGMAGTLGDIAGAGEHSPYRWGVGLQGMAGPDEQRIMAGLRLDF